MRAKPFEKRAAGTLLCAVLAACSSGSPVKDAAMATQADAAVDWSAAKSLGSVDERFQSFNVEMVEVTGGRFWAPFGGGSREMFEYRPPLDMGDTRLRNLTRHLAPAYMRVSGTWANKTFFDDKATTDSAKTTPPKPPAGFDSVLTAAQWDAVNQFALDLDLRVMTSFATSPGTRDAKGQWATDNARRLIEYSTARHYPLVAAELVNEPNTGEIAGMPKNYTAEQFRSEFNALTALRNQLIPGMKLAGPGTGADDSPMFATIPFKLSPSGLSIAQATAPAFDIISYHFYPATSSRCAPMGLPQTSKEVALSEEFLATTEVEAGYFKKLRDRFEPGKPVWLSEGAGAACGGNPWSAEFLDTFRYVEQLGRLARQGVQVVMHNTLSASDYGLIDDHSGEPRPNYWAAVLWRQLLGERVLDLPVDNTLPNVSVYAHCLRGDKEGGVALVAVNRNKDRTLTLRAAQTPVAQYALTAADLSARTVLLNGRPLTADKDGNFAPLSPVTANSGVVTLQPLSINFLTVRDIHLPACK
jgi:heparanase